jgi:hypothetical protein
MEKLLFLIYVPLKSYQCLKDIKLPKLHIKNQLNNYNYKKNTKKLKVFKINISKRIDIYNLNP